MRLMSKNPMEPLRIGRWKQDLRVHRALGGTESEAKELELAACPCSRADTREKLLTTLGVP